VSRASVNAGKNSVSIIGGFRNSRAGVSNGRAEMRLRMIDSGRRHRLSQRSPFLVVRGLVEHAGLFRMSMAHSGTIFPFPIRDSSGEVRR